MDLGLKNVALSARGEAGLAAAVKEMQALGAKAVGIVAAFLISEKNSYMTGTTVEVCGGFTRYI